MWCPDCQQQVAVRLKPGESAVRCARCGAKFSAPSQSRRIDDAAALAAAAPLQLRAAVMAGGGAKVAACPISTTSSWLIDEDIRHIGRMATSALRADNDRAQLLDALLQGRGFDETDWSAAEDTAEPAGDDQAVAMQEVAAVEQVDSTASLPELTIPASPLADQLQAARRPSKWAVGLGHAAGAIGGLALVNGLGLAAWSRFGGRQDLASLSIPICLTALGLLFVSHLLQANDVPPRTRPG